MCAQEELDNNLYSRQTHVAQFWLVVSCESVVALHRDNPHLK